MQDQSQIGPYVIESKIGAGGMGVVYRAVDTTLDRPVAIKVLLPEFVHDPELLRRFRLEAKAQANLNHPNIAVLYAFTEIDGQCLIVMELLEGETFADILEKRGRLPWQGAVSLTQQTLQGLGLAHSRGVVHRDIKPSNLMLTRSGVVKIMDFGIAKAVSNAKATRTGTLGTPTYMSPEQIKGEGIDARSDLYSVGITLYQLLSGKVPFEGTTDFQVMNAHLNIAPPPLHELAADIPRPVIQCVERALSKEKIQRFQSAEEFDQALAAAKLPGPAPRGQPTILETPTPPVRPPVPRTIEVAPPAAHPPAARPEPLRPPVIAQRPAKKSGIPRYVLVALAAVVIVGALLAIGFWPKSDDKNTTTGSTGSQTPAQTGQANAAPADNTPFKPTGRQTETTPRNEPKPPASQRPVQQAWLLLNPDAACIVSIDGAQVKQLAAGQPAKVDIAQGQHLVQAKDVVTGYQIQRMITVSGFGQQVVNLPLGAEERDAAAQQDAARKRQQQQQQREEQAAAEQRRRQQEEQAAAEQRRRQQEEEAARQAARPKFANITVAYTGDSYGCTLLLKINIGGRSFQPTGSSYAVSGVPVGVQNYGVTGTIGCRTAGVCTVSGYGTLNILEGSTFNVGWANTSYGRCSVQLLPR
jgi:serine/threonine-protein kinase